MDKETKSILKVGGIALIVMIIVFGILFAMKSDGKGTAHKHGDGTVHSH